MRSQITILFLSIYLIQQSVTWDHFGEQCSCSCCLGIGCAPETKPDFPVPLCSDDDSVCVNYCRMIYPDCGDIYSEVFAVCVSKTSKVSSQYAILIFLILFLLNRYFSM